MFFARPVDLGSPLTVTGGHPVATAAPNMATSGSAVLFEGTCTSDKKLMWSAGAWRVVSDPSSVACQFMTSYDSSVIFDAWKNMSPEGQQAHPIYVGPFPFNPFDTNPATITTLDFPSTIEALARPVLQKMIVDYANAVTLPNILTGWNQMKPPPAYSMNCADYQDPNFLTKITKDAKLGGLVLGQSFSAGVDQWGFPAQKVQFPNDPTIYTWYSPCDWLESIAPGLSATANVLNNMEQDILGTFNALVDKSGNHWQDWLSKNPPITKFRHPITGDAWGLWIGLAPDITEYREPPINATSNTSAFFMNAPVQLPAGAWNPYKNGPNSFHFNIGFMKIPQESFLDAVGYALQWVPEQIGSAITAVGTNVMNAIQALACSNPQQATKMVAGNPAALAALIALQATCNQALDCSNPANAKNPQCKPVPPPPTPWWQQWYVIVPGLGVLGYILFKALGSPRRSAATA